MPISFPTSPVINDTYAYLGKVWTWNGSVWQANSTATVVGPEGPQGATGPEGPMGPAVNVEDLTLMNIMGAY
jgi:hypothetical protein